MFKDKTIGERFAELRKSKKDKYGKEMPIIQLANELSSKKYIKDYKADIIRQEIGKVENRGKFPQLFLIKGYCEYFKVTSDYLLGIRNTKPINENIAMIAKVTGLSDDAIKILRLWKKDKGEYATSYPALATDTNIIDLILRYEYEKKKNAGEYPASHSIFYYIGCFLFAKKYEKQPQDCLRICDGFEWREVQKGDVLKQGNVEYSIQGMEAINSITGSGNNPDNLHIWNKENICDRRVVPIDGLYESFSKDNIFRELDKIRNRYCKRETHSNLKNK